LIFALCPLPFALQFRDEESQKAKGKNKEGESQGQHSDLGSRLLRHAGRVIKLVRALPKDIIGRCISDQLVRCNMAVGANYEEAQAGESHEDFVHKRRQKAPRGPVSRWSSRRTAPRCLSDFCLLILTFALQVGTKKGKGKHKRHE
jgi:hypothetical protein